MDPRWRERLPTAAALRRRAQTEILSTAASADQRRPRFLFLADPLFVEVRAAPGENSRRYNVVVIPWATDLEDRHIGKFEPATNHIFLQVAVRDLDREYLPIDRYGTGGLFLYHPPVSYGSEVVVVGSGRREHHFRLEVQRIRTGVCARIAVNVSNIDAGIFAPIPGDIR